MLVKLRPLTWAEIPDHPLKMSVTNRTPFGSGAVSWWAKEDADLLFPGGSQEGWYWNGTWSHPDDHPFQYHPCDSLEHGKACVEASYLAHLKPAFDFVEAGDEQDR